MNFKASLGIFFVLTCTALINDCLSQEIASEDKPTDNSLKAIGALIPIYKNASQCSATIIDGNYLLTAGHCVDDLRATGHLEGLYFCPGCSTEELESSTQPTYRVEKMWTKGHFKSKNDFGLLRVEQKAGEKSLADQFGKFEIATPEESLQLRKDMTFTLGGYPMGIRQIQHSRILVGFEESLLKHRCPQKIELNGDSDCLASSSGMSGGPMIRKFNGVFKIFGVHIGTNGSVLEAGTATSVFYEWVKSIIEDPENSFNLAPVHEKNSFPEKIDTPSLIVVHASEEFDRKRSAAHGIDLLVKDFKAKRQPVIYLVNDESKNGAEAWYTEDRSPDYQIFSEGGEHNLPISSDEVTIAGGYFGSYDARNGCLTLAVRDAIRMHFEISDRPFTIFLPIHGIFFWEDDEYKRNEMLGLDGQKTNEVKRHKVFDNFSKSFFIRETFSEIPEFSHPYFPFGHPTQRNLHYRPGEPVNIDRYSFELFFNDISVGKFGTGKRKVLLRMKNSI